MKKVLFLQNKGNSCGGVWFVNKTIGESLLKKGYDVEIMGVRDSKSNISLEYDPNLKVSILNKKDLWEITKFSDIKSSLKDGKIVESLRLIMVKIIDEVNLKKDYRKIKSYIRKNRIDYIITTHYQLLDAIPYEYLSRTFHEQHTSFGASINHNATRKIFNKYKDKIKFIWLTKETCDEAISYGYKNSTYIYNPVRFISDKKVENLENKKLVTIARISNEKRIDLMIEIVSDIFKDKRFDGWSLEIYGDGNIKDKIMKMNYDKERIIFKGVTDSPKEVFLSSSINLNTSLFEGFSMSILEAAECGVPTITFNFGESAKEEIIQDKTGIIVPQDDIVEYKNKLMKLMEDEELFKKLSNNSKKFAYNFHIDRIIEKWIDTFKEIDS
jgi:glycosyltransferase involved in cell wall biosynthesis